MDDAGAKALVKAIFSVKGAPEGVYSYVVLENGKRQSLAEAVKAVLDSLPQERQRCVLDLRFGLGDGKKRSLQEVAASIHVKSRQRAYQIQERALQLLLHPKRSRVLRRFLVPTPESLAQLGLSNARLAYENEKLHKEVDVLNRHAAILEAIFVRRRIPLPRFYPLDRERALVKMSFAAAEELLPHKVHSLRRLRNALSRGRIFTFAEFSACVESGELKQIPSIGVALLELAKEVIRIGENLQADEE